MTGIALHLGFESVEALARYRGNFDQEMSPEKKAERKEYIRILTRAKTRMLDQKLTYAIIGEFDSKMVTLDLAAHHNISANPKPETEQNFTFAFVDATKASGKKGSDKGSGDYDQNDTES